MIHLIKPLVFFLNEAASLNKIDSVDWITDSLKDDNIACLKFIY